MDLVVGQPAVSDPFCSGLRRQLASLGQFCSAQGPFILKLAVDFADFLVNQGVTFIDFRKTPFDVIVVPVAAVQQGPSQVRRERLEILPSTERPCRPWPTDGP